MGYLPVFDWLKSGKKEELAEVNLEAKSFLLNRSMVVKKTIENLKF